MIYDYYCVDCGKKMKGSEIAFDLTGMLALEAGLQGLSRAPFEELAELLAPEFDLYKQGRQPVWITLEQFMAVLCRNAIKNKYSTAKEAEREREYQRVMKEIQSGGYANLDETIRELINTYGNRAEENAEIGKVLDSIKARFQPEFDQEEAEKEKAEADNAVQEAEENAEKAEKEAADAEKKVKAAEGLFEKAKRQERDKYGFRFLDPDSRNQIHDSELLDAEEVQSAFKNLEDAKAALQKAREAVKNAQKEAEKAKQTASRVMYNQLKNYHAFLCLEPEFFDGQPGSKQIYTLRYSLEKNPSNMQELNEPGEFRGYCPHCGARVIKGAGKYPHRLIGLLGASSAGKTSTIISMLDDVMNHYDEYGLDFPGSYLCDDRFEIIGWNLKLFRAGWSVLKTPEKAGKTTFNASMLLRSGTDLDNQQIITFVDIPGEQCYDWETKQWRPEALKEFPLIGHCAIYLLCSCIDENAYGEIGENGLGRQIDPDGILTIAEGLYGSLKMKQEYKTEPKLPPVCIIATKADLTEEPAGEEKGTPFDHILRSRGAFLHREQVEKLRDLYKSVQNESIRRPLNWYARTYDSMSKITYVSMMACSALGGTREQYTEDESGQEKTAGNTSVISLKKQVKKNPINYPCPMGMDHLWKWLLEVLGLTAISDEGGSETGFLPQDTYILSDIPAWEDYYKTTSKIKDGKRRVFDIDEAMNRIRAVKWLFLNSSQKDEELLRAYSIADNRERNRLFHWGSKTRMRRAIENCADRWK